MNYINKWKYFKWEKEEQTCNDLAAQVSTPLKTYFLKGPFACNTRVFQVQFCSTLCCTNAPDLSNWERSAVQTPFQVIPEFLVGFRSGLCLGHFKTLIFLLWSQLPLLSWICALGHCCAKEVRFFFIFSCLTEAGFLFGIWSYPYFQLKRSHPIIWCCHHHALPCIWCSLGIMCLFLFLFCSFFSTNRSFRIMPIIFSLVSSDHNMTCHMFQQNWVRILLAASLKRFSHVLLSILVTYPVLHVTRVHGVPWYI